MAVQLLANPLPGEASFMTNQFISANEEAIIDGKFKLGAIVNRSIAGTIYQTQYEQDAGSSVPAVIKILDLDPERTKSTLRRWLNALDLVHPSLLRLFVAGVSEMEGAPVVYLVMERADESLAAVLTERTLSEDEVREMLEPTVAALRYLHKNGYAHGALRPSKVLAVRDQLKLATDCVIQVTNGDEPAADMRAEDPRADDPRAEDMRALGALILQSLTQKLPGEVQPEVYDSLPGPFAAIVRHCLEPNPAMRWTSDQVAAHLRADGAVPHFEEARIEPAAAEAPDIEPSRGMPKWIVAGLSALVLVVLLAAVLRKKEPVTAPVAPAPAVVMHEAPSANQPLPARVPPAHIQHVAGRRQNGWSVIVAAYSSREAAAKRMRSLAAKFPGFHASLIEHPSERAHYLIVLGENLSEDAAESLRQRAVKAGLPRDTYIKKLT